MSSAAKSTSRQNVKLPYRHVEKSSGRQLPSSDCGISQLPSCQTSALLLHSALSAKNHATNPKTSRPF